MSLFKGLPVAEVSEKRLRKALKKLYLRIGISRRARTVKLFILRAERSEVEKGCLD